MRRAFGLGVATVAALTLWSGNALASTTFQPRVGAALGLFPSYASANVATGAATAVDYNGGAVMASTVTVHTIFWAPAGYAFTAGYEGLVKQFLTDAAAGTGTSSNVFSVLRQYGQQTGPDTAVPGSYSIAYTPSSDSMDDVNPYPSSGGCQSPSGALTCLTDGQVQAEINAVAPADERGLGNLWFMLLPPDVDECITADSCGTNAFAGYHEAMPATGGVTIYGVIIDPIIEYVVPPGADPLGNPDAEATIDTVAHETVEAITDPEGTGWEDPNGFEVADKCEVGPQIGGPLGYAPDGSPYDQLIGGHEYLIQEMWSNDDGGCVQRTTRATSPLPLPQVNLTQFSSTVSGNIGAESAGVHVTVSILRERPGAGATTPTSSSTTTPVSPSTIARRNALATTVAQASTTTHADGGWSLSLAPFAVGDDRDLVKVAYSGTPLAPDYITTGDGGDPFTQAGWTGWLDLNAGADVSNGNGGSVTLGPCFQAGVLTLDVGSAGYSANEPCNAQTNTATIATGRISAATAITVSSNENRAFTEPQAVLPSLDPQGNEAGALVDLTVKLGEAGAVSTFSSPLADVDPHATPTGFPRCTADLQFGAAVCTGLVKGAAYSVTRARGADRLTGRADTAGTLVVGPFRGAPPLTGGDVLTLSNGRRTLTTLHVAHLRAVVFGQETVLGPGSRCQPGLYYGAPPSSAPFSSTAGLTGEDGATLTGRVCPRSGSAEGLSDRTIAETDDRSGGLTVTEVAGISSTSPTDGETLYGRFTARAQAGFLGRGDAIIPSLYPVALTITSANGRKLVKELLDVNTASGTPIKGLKPGTYEAVWTWHDFTGDSRTIITSFVEEPATAPAQAGSTSTKATIACAIVQRPNACAVRGGSLVRTSPAALPPLSGPQGVGLARAWLHAWGAKTDGARGPGRRGPP